MATLTIAEAARCCRVARSTLQRAIQAGRLSLTQDHRVDTAELLRAGYTLHAAQQPRYTMRQTNNQTQQPRCRNLPHAAVARVQRFSSVSMLWSVKTTDYS